MNTEVVAKKWYKSKTMWFNIVAFGIMFTDGLSSLITGLAPLIPEPGMIILGFAIPMVNLFLRSITTAALEKK